MRQIDEINQAIRELDRISNPVDRETEAKKLRNEKKKYYGSKLGISIVKDLDNAISWIWAGRHGEVPTTIELADKAIERLIEKGIMIHNIIAVREYVRLTITVSGF